MPSRRLTLNIRRQNGFTAEFVRDSDGISKLAETKLTCDWEKNGAGCGHCRQLLVHCGDLVRIWVPEIVEDPHSMDGLLMKKELNTRRGEWLSAHAAPDDERPV